MTKITHPSMGRVRDTSAPGVATQSFVVEDETNTQAVENESYEAPAHKLVEPMRANTETKNILESLIFLGSSSREIEIGEHKFKITTLTHREHNQLMKELYRFGDGADLFTLRTLTLALALKTVNNIPLENLQLPDEEIYATPFDKKLAIIDSMQMNVVTKLYNEYNELLRTVDEQVDGQVIKNL